MANPLSALKDWLAGYVFSKGLKRVGTFIVTYGITILASSKVLALLATAGITIDLDKFKVAMDLLVGSFFAWGLNLIKFKTDGKLPVG